MSRRIAIALGVLAIAAWGASANLSDTHGSLFNRLAGGDHTKWAKGFSEDAFAHVTSGMKPAEVRWLLGEPVFKAGGLDATSCGGDQEDLEEVWSYSWFDDRPYRWLRGHAIRNVVFLSQQVVRTERGYAPTP